MQHNITSGNVGEVSRRAGLLALQGTIIVGYWTGVGLERFGRLTHSFFTYLQGRHDQWNAGLKEIKIPERPLRSDPASIKEAVAAESQTAPAAMPTKSQDKQLSTAPGPSNTEVSTPAKDSAG
jgi:hypothetical protein